MSGEVEGEVFLNKLGEIPVLNDGWFVAADYYSRVKDYNALMRMTLSMAESSVKVAGQLSTPVLNRYQPQLDNINDYACKKLDELEDKYPAIKQPTEQWKETCTDLVEPVVVRVKPVISQVQGIVSSSKQKISGIKTASSNMVVEVKNRGVGTVNHVVNSTFETVPGRFITRTVDGALNVADNLVDKYMPEEESDSKTNGEDSDKESSTGDIEEMEEMDPTPNRVLIHAQSVTEKIRTRMYRKAMKDLTYARARTVSALNRMTKTVELIDYAKKNLNTAKDKVDHMWTDIVKDDPADERTVFAGTIEDRIVALGRLVARQVKSGVTSFEKAYSEFGEFGKHPISKSREYKEFIATFLTIESIQNISSQSLEKAKDSLKFMQDNFQSVISVTPTLKWMAVDINMEDIPLNESDLGMEQVMSKNNNSEDEIEREETR